MSNKKKVEKEKNLYMITVTMQFNHEFTDEEVDEGDPIKHEIIVSGCVDCLADKNYDVKEDEM